MQVSRPVSRSRCRRSFCLTHKGRYPHAVNVSPGKTESGEPEIARLLMTNSGEEKLHMKVFRIVDMRLRETGTKFQRSVDIEGSYCIDRLLAGAGRGFLLEHDNRSTTRRFDTVGRRRLRFWRQCATVMNVEGLE